MPPAGLRYVTGPTGNLLILAALTLLDICPETAPCFRIKTETAYFISASRDNADLHMYRLTEDYLNVDCLVHKLWQGEYREAPAVMEREGKILYVFLLLYRLGAQSMPVCDG